MFASSRPAHAIVQFTIEERRDICHKQIVYRQAYRVNRRRGHSATAAPAAAPTGKAASMLDRMVVLR
jgi:hypothetical protein